MNEFKLSMGEWIDRIHKLNGMDKKTIRIMLLWREQPYYDFQKALWQLLNEKRIKEQVK